MKHGPALDAWTLVHLFSGAALAQAGVSRFAAYGLIIGTEIAEQALRQMFPGTTVLEETSDNVVADLAASLGAYEITRARSSGT